MQSVFRLMMPVLLVVWFWDINIVTAQTQERKFYSGQAGILPPDSDDMTRTYFDNEFIRPLIYQLESGSVSEADVLEALSATEYAIDDLLRVKLLRKAGDQYFLGFNYFNLADMREVSEMARKRVPGLVSAYLDKGAEFDAIFDKYPAETVSRDVLAFSLIAGMSLNWDGLKITLNSGFRTPVLVTGDGWQYSFWASEEVPGHDTKGFYWGSSTAPFGTYNYDENPADYSFSSFGDPFSDPRMNFPDLFFLQPSNMAETVVPLAQAVGLSTNTELSLTIDNVLGANVMRQTAIVLFALRERSLNLAELEAALGGYERLPALMALLIEVQYVSKTDDGQYQLLVPVLDYADSEMVREAMALSELILVTWLSENLSDIEAELSDLTALKHGVPFGSLFTQIWHEIFGLTTRELAVAGMIADGYDPGRKYPGSYGILWRHKLYDLRFE